MTVHASKVELDATVAAARSKVAELRALAERSLVSQRRSPACIAGLEARLSKVEGRP